MASSHEYITEYGHDVVGLYNTCILKAVIISVDYDNDKADIELTEPALGLRSGVPVFYHCAGNEDTVGGSVAFSEDDEVLVFCRNCKDGSFPGSLMKIVGFVGGLKHCCIPAYMDGIVSKRVWGKTWSSVRDSPFGNSVQPYSYLAVYAGYADPPGYLTHYYEVCRTFMNFDFSGVYRQIKGVTLKLYSRNYDGTPSDANVLMVQEGTQGDDTLVDNDFSSFTGLNFTEATWSVEEGAVNEFIFNEEGISYINAIINSETENNVKLCLREHTHDYLNVPPTDDKQSYGYSVTSGEERLIGIICLK